MRVPALLLAGSVAIGTAQAQSDGADIKFLPMPKTLPQVFFAPDSLAGSMLKPLVLPEAAPETAQVTDESAVGQKEPEAKPDAGAQGEPGQGAAEPEGKPAAAPEPEPAKPSEEPAPPTTSTIHVIVENVESNRGSVKVAVCDTGLSEEGCPYHTSVPAVHGFVEAIFNNIPPGTYAVVGYHDVNDNNKFDKFLAMPREPYALSGAAADKLIPDFTDATLKINPGENYVIIHMKRLGGG